jgi:hypothetical protein
MATAVTVLVVLAILAAVLGGLPWLAARARRRGIGGSPLTSFDEIWHPAAHQARIQVEVQDQRVAPAPSPGDPPDRAAAGSDTGEPAGPQAGASQPGVIP